MTNKVGFHSPYWKITVMYLGWRRCRGRHISKRESENIVDVISEYILEEEKKGNIPCALIVKAISFAQIEDQELKFNSAEWAVSVTPREIPESLPIDR